MSVFNIDKSPLTDSSKRFKIPETILSDYENYLNTEVPHAVYDFQLIQDWYDQFNDGYEKVMLRAEHFPINWKSKVGNSDANHNFYTSYRVPIRKGDIVIREDGIICMLNWSIQRYINAQTTQAIDCNHRITITRDIPAVADNRGMLVTPATKKIIVDDLPCVMSEYGGRTDLTSSQGTPGVSSDSYSLVNMQYNEKTKEVRVGDEFEWGIFSWRVVNVNYAEVDITNTYGILTLGIRRIAGESLV